jgi:hypothetical protein
MCALPAGPHKQHPLIKLDAAGQPHQHVDLLSPKTHTNRQRQQRQQRQQQQQQQQQQQKDSSSSGGSARQPAPAAVDSAAAAAAAAAAQVPAAAAAAAAEFGEASDVQLEEMEALEVRCKPVTLVAPVTLETTVIVPR